MVITMSRFWSSLVILAALGLPLASSHAAPDPLHPGDPPASLPVPGADLLILAQAGGIAPTAIPRAPSSLRAVAASSTQINLTWTDASTNEAGFQIQRKIGTGAWLPLATVGRNVTALANNGLIPSTTYGYRVRAFDGRDNSAWSNIATVRTPSGSVTPPAPTGLTATVASQSQINLSWIDNSSNETLFKIERKIGTGAWAQIATVGANVTTYANTGLIAATRYSYRVRAASGSINSLYSNVVSATIPRPIGPAAPTGLTAAAVSAAQINLTWSDNSSNETSFKIERKTGTGAWSEIVTLAANVVTYPNTGLTASTLYTYRLRACNTLGCSGYSNEASATTPSGGGPRLRLNDTGIDGCADGSRNNLPCPVTGYPEQDAQFGRDRTANDDSDGQAGFSFTKLDANGNALPVSATVWSCVRDNVTGRVWEEKTNDRGLRHKDWSYTWYNPNTATNGGLAGTPNGGSCSGSQCDTHAYVQAVNAAGLCGARDWRMPTVSELLSIVSNDRVEPAFETAFFRNLSSIYPWFWSSSPYADGSYYAWLVRIKFGSVDSTNKGYASCVRLVRGGQ